MSFWSFSRREAEPASAEELRERLIAAAGSQKKLKRLCRNYAEMARANVGVLVQVPEEMRTQAEDDPVPMQQYVQRLGIVAHCLAECGVPEVWKTLVGSPETNPILRWDEWLGKVQERLAALEHDALIAEAREMIAEARQLEGSAARLYEGYLRGRIGEALFHSGRVDDAAIAYEEALQYCRETNDLDGVATYLGNLKEVARYRGDTKSAIGWLEELASLQEANDLTTDAGETRKEMARLYQGEPPVRTVCRLPDGTVELDEVQDLEEGISYKFEFVRNRPGIQKCIALTKRGSQLASQGELADALERFEEASDVDSFDPDPVYQSGVVLMELGAYDQARARFDEVVRIAPGWYHSRFDRWLAEKLHESVYPQDVWTLYRGLQDNGFTPKQVLPLARQAVEQFDDFAAFWLMLGDAQRDTGDTKSASESFRRGLACAEEPDVESRLLLSLGTVLDPQSPERQDLLEQAASLDGNLFAQSVARVMLLQSP